MKTIMKQFYNSNLKQYYLLFLGLIIGFLLSKFVNDILLIISIGSIIFAVI